MKLFMVSALAIALASAAMANPLASIDSDFETATTSDIHYDERNDIFDNHTTSEQSEDSEALILQPVPAYDPPTPRTGCNLFPETSKVVVWDEVDRQVCEDSVETGCGSCITDLYQIGFEGLQIKSFQNCNITYKAEPLKLSRGTTTIQTETVCEYVDETHCEFRWVLEDNGDKTWKEDPDTCKTLQVTKCEKVPKTRVSATDIDLTIQKPEGICCDVVRDDCHTIHERVPRQQEVTTWKEVCPLPPNTPVQPERK